MVFLGNFFLTLKRIPLSVTPAPPTGPTEPIVPLLYSFASTTSISDTYQGGKDIIMSNDGYKLWVLVDGNNADNDQLIEYSLSTPWDVSTKTLSVSKTIFNSITCESFCFNGDGTKIYVHAAVDSSTKISKIYDYPLSTAYDLSTLNTSSVNITSLSPSGDRPGQRIVSMNFNGDGTKIFLTNVDSVSGSDSNTYIYVFSLSTTYDVSSLSGKDPYSSSDVDYTVDYSTFAGSGVNLQSWKFIDNGNYLYGVYPNYGGVILDLTSNPYELSSYTIVENVTDDSLDSILDPSGFERAIVFQEPLEAGSKFVLFTPNYLYTRQFNLSVPPYPLSNYSVDTSNTFNFSSGDVMLSYDGTKSVGYQLPSGDLTIVKIGIQTLSTPFTVSSTGSVSVSSNFDRDQRIRCVCMIRDSSHSDYGKKFWVSGDLSETSLFTATTAWDPTSGSWSTEISAVSGNPRIRWMDFRDDGLKWDTIEDTGTSDFRSYNLTTAYDLSSVSIGSPDLTITDFNSGIGFTSGQTASIEWVNGGKYCFVISTHGVVKFVDTSSNPYDPSLLVSANVLDTDSTTFNFTNDEIGFYPDPNNFKTGSKGVVISQSTGRTFTAA